MASLLLLFDLLPIDVTEYIIKLLASSDYGFKDYEELLSSRIFNIRLKDDKEKRKRIEQCFLITRNIFHQLVFEQSIPDTGLHNIDDDDDDRPCKSDIRLYTDMGGKRRMGRTEEWWKYGKPKRKKFFDDNDNLMCNYEYRNIL